MGMRPAYKIAIGGYGYFQELGSLPNPLELFVKQPLLGKHGQLVVQLSFHADASGQNSYKKAP